MGVASHVVGVASLHIHGLTFLNPTHLEHLITFFSSQRNCLYFALTARPKRQAVPKYQIQRRCRKSLLPIVDGVVVKGVVILVLIFNTLILCSQVRGGGGREGGREGGRKEYSNVLCS